MTGPLDLVCERTNERVKLMKIATREEVDPRAVLSFFRVSPFSRVVRKMTEYS